MRLSLSRIFKEIHFDIAIKSSREASDYALHFLNSATERGTLSRIAAGVKKRAQRDKYMKYSINICYKIVNSVTARKQGV